MLSQSWVERIFTRLTGIYGTRFTKLWENIDIGLVQRTWAHELAYFAEHPEGIQYALENLPPDHPPTALAFKKLCMSMPAPVLKALPVAAADVARRDAELAKVNRKAVETSDRAWAWDLKERDRLHPESVTPTIRKMYQAVTGA